MNQAMTTAHQTSYWFHQLRCSGSHAGTESREVTIMHFRANLASKPCRRWRTLQSRKRGLCLFRVRPSSGSAFDVLACSALVLKSLGTGL